MIYEVRLDLTSQPYLQFHREGIWRIYIIGVSWIFSNGMYVETPMWTFVTRNGGFWELCEYDNIQLDANGQKQLEAEYHRNLLNAIDDRVAKLPQEIRTFGMKHWVISEVATILSFDLPMDIQRLIIMALMRQIIYRPRTLRSACSGKCTCGIK